MAACDSLPPEDQGLCLDNARKKVDAEIAIRAEERLFEMLQLERARLQLESERVQLESERVQLEKETVQIQKESHNWTASDRNSEIYVFGSAVDMTSESSVFISFLSFAFVFSGALLSLCPSGAAKPVAVVAAFVGIMVSILIACVLFQPMLAWVAFVSGGAILILAGLMLLHFVNGKRKTIQAVLNGERDHWLSYVLSIVLTVGVVSLVVLSRGFFFADPSPMDASAAHA